MTTPIAQELRAWAAGSYPVEAATELLIRAFRGRFAQPSHPWMHRDGGHCIDFDTITDETTGVYSGGQQRVLALAAALGGDRWINLSDAVPGLDRSVAMLFLAAIAHASGSHEHSDLTIDPGSGIAHPVALGSLFPWPK